MKYQTESISQWDLRRMKQKILDRIKRPSLGCWSWTGAAAGDGVPRVMVASNHRHVNYVVARAMYFFEHDHVPAINEVVGHLCRNKRCLNPAHLELLTPEECHADSSRSSGTGGHDAQ